MKGGLEVGRTKTTRSLGRTVLSSPLLVAVAVAVLVVFVLSFAGYVRRGGFWSPEVEARVLTRGRALDSSGQSLNGQRMFAFQGEVYSDAERLREAAALGVGSMLLATLRNLDHAPISSVEALLRAMASDGLLPPDMVLDQSGPSVTSKYAVYYVRYQSDPLGVEIVSIGKGISGPPLLVRLPDDEFSQNALTYYVAPRTGGGVTVPAAFAAPAQIIATGWQPVTFKSNSVSLEEAEKGKQWLAGGNSQSSSSR